MPYIYNVPSGTNFLKYGFSIHFIRFEAQNDDSNQKVIENSTDFSIFFFIFLDTQILGSFYFFCRSHT